MIVTFVRLTSEFGSSRAESVERFTPVEAAEAAAATAEETPEGESDMTNKGR